MNITDIKSMYNTEKTYSYQVLALHICGDMCKQVKVLKLGDHAVEIDSLRERSRG